MKGVARHHRADNIDTLTDELQRFLELLRASIDAGDVRVEHVVRVFLEDLRRLLAITATERGSARP
jgi:hypothetical protein